jgi:hypothetical protein
MPFAFLRHAAFKFQVIAEIIFLEFDCVSLGVCNGTRDSVVFNPRLQDLQSYDDMRSFFRTYNVLVIMASDQYIADSISEALNNQQRMKSASERMIKEEDIWPCHLDDKQKSNVFDADSDSDDDDDGYIGFVNYNKQDTAESAPESPQMKKIWEAPDTFVGPASHMVPRNKSAVKKIRLISAIQSSDVSIRRMALSFAPVPGALGQPSATLNDASTLRNHVVVFGCDTYLQMFISELRRPAVSGESYHPIVLISEEEPPGWDQILEKYNDLYYIKANMTKNTVVTKANLAHAFSLIFLAPRDQNNTDTNNTIASNNTTINIDEGKDSVDAINLFAFLKLEQLIPENVFCSLELNSSANMAVLNATIMKRARRLALDVKRAELKRQKKEKHTKQLDHHRSGSTNVPRASVVSSRRTFSSNVTSLSDQLDKDERAIIEHNEVESNCEKLVWEAVDKNHIFPVYASARVFVPSSFETLLVQSFFVKLTPVICERLICGQLTQTVQQVTVPSQLVGRRFVDCFRLFTAFDCISLGLYRYPRKQIGAMLPFVFNSPPADTILYESDKIFLFGGTKSIQKAIASLKTQRQNLYGL